MKRIPMVKAVIAVAAVVSLGACASTELAYYDFEGESIRVIVRVAPGARVNAEYFVTIDPDDMVETIISVGTSIAKASQVEVAQQKLDAVMHDLDIEAILNDEVGSYYADVMDMEVTDSRTRASYVLNIDVTRYGIEAGNPGAGVDFVLSGSAELIDNASGRRIWRDGFRESEQFSPRLFGIPDSAGNVVSAAMLSELTEEDIAYGVDRVTREAAWDLTREFERDLYRARRNR